jgi:hypothetical protein
MTNLTSKHHTVVMSAVKRLQITIFLILRHMHSFFDCGQSGHMKNHIQQVNNQAVNHNHIGLCVLSNVRHVSASLQLIIKHRLNTT